jgi:hypothetical protein
MINKISTITLLLFPMLVFSQKTSVNNENGKDTINDHKVVLDKNGKLLPWYQPAGFAYDDFLRKRWDFVKTKTPNAPGPGVTAKYPQYYFYCAFLPVKDSVLPDNWMNDIGEKIPNWFEAARLYYAYTGDSSVMKIVKDLVDYHLQNGVSPSDFSWPHFPFATANAGDSLYRGFTTADRFLLYETQVDHSGDIALTWLYMYLFYDDTKYLEAAIKTADLLAAKVREGSLRQSPWPYLVNAKTGESRAEYGANWIGCYTLLDKLIKMKTGNYMAYENARIKLRNFLIAYPLQTGYWTDGHTDTYVNNPSYKSNMSKSNFALYLFDNPGFLPEWKQYMPKLLRWTEKYFVERSAKGESGTLWGAYVVGEQDSFMIKMDYQTARYAAECARWYAVSGDAQYKEKAYRSLNFVTYCSDPEGRSFESPLSKGIGNWWSDCYGECPRMFYHVFAAIPEFAPPGENHILYSEGILKNVFYQPKKIQYTSTADKGIEFLRVAFKPVKASINGKIIPLRPNIKMEMDGYTLKSLENGDYALTIKRSRKGTVVIIAK